MSKMIGSLFASSDCRSFEVCLVWRHERIGFNFFVGLKAFMDTFLVGSLIDHSFVKRNMNMKANGWVPAGHAVSYPRQIIA